MLVEPNFDEVSSPVVAGDYAVAISSAEAGEYQSGLKYINWTLETVNSADPKDNGRKIFYKTPITGKAAFLLQNLYVAAVGEVPSGAFNTEQLISRQIHVTLVDGMNRATGEPTGYTEVKAVRKIS